MLDLFSKPTKHSPVPREGWSGS